ncbi:hypothetical protein Ancab_017670 [Ancistrocladus abbreviatus]
MEGYYPRKNDTSTVLKLVNNNSTQNNTPSGNNSMSRARYSPESNDSMLMRYLLTGQPSNECTTLCNPQMIANPYNKCNVSGSSSSSSRGSRGFSLYGSSASVSTLSPIENVQRLPLSPSLKFEEDVLVMDGILVGSAVSGAGKSRVYSVSDSGGSSSSYSPGSSIYKKFLCQSWEDSGSCQFGLKCLFAHGKEELRPTHFASKNNAEMTISKQCSSAGSCTHGPRRHFARKVMTNLPVKESAALASSTVNTSSPIEPKHTPRSSPLITSRDWSPLDDGIEVKLPSSVDKPPSREAVAEHIDSVLYGPSEKKRLPAFVDSCTK